MPLAYFGLELSLASPDIPATSCLPAITIMLLAQSEKCRGSGGRAPGCWAVLNTRVHTRSDEPWIPLSSLLRQHGADVLDLGLV